MPRNRETPVHVTNEKECRSRQKKKWDNARLRIVPSFFIQHNPDAYRHASVCHSSTLISRTISWMLVVPPKVFSSNV